MTGRSGDSRNLICLGRSWGRIHKALAFWMGLLLLFGSLLLPVAQVQANTHPVTLKDLQVKDAIFLPTVRSQRELVFTKPKTWNVSGSTAVVMTFQHSIQLLPDRSWLQVILNDKKLTHIPLTKANANATTVRVPIPAGALQEVNRLAFRVEQHYTNKCEDPTDSSLWTQILPNTHIAFDYSETLPTLSLAELPFPIVDPLNYIPQKLHYVVPEKMSNDTLQALAYVNVFFAQASQRKGLKTLVSHSGDPFSKDAPEHIIYVGTASQLHEVSALSGAIQGVGSGVRLSGGQWVGASGPLEGDAGVVVVLKNPQRADKAILIVSGNSERGVLQAAKMVTTRPTPKELAGSGTFVSSNWMPEARQSVRPRLYIETQSVTYDDLGIGAQTVHKINAPPIEYSIPVVGDFSSGGTLIWDVVYSYGPELNPLFSSLELRINDKPIANIPLRNQESGEQMQRFSVKVPNDLIRTKNLFVAQFHLMPEKYGWCVDEFVDNAWGTVHQESGFRVEGHVKPNLPDLNGINDGLGYPYTKTHHLANLHLQLASSQMTREALRALVAVTTRLGRMTLADTDLRFSVGSGTGGIPGGKDVIVITNGNTAGHDGQAHLKFPEGGNLLQFKFLDNYNYKIEAQSGQTVPVLEEAWRDGSTVVTLLTGSSSFAMNQLADLLEHDPDFETLETGTLAQFSPFTPILNMVRNPVFYDEDESPQSALNNIPWMFIIIAGLVALLGLLLLLPIVVRLLKRSR